jgi:hypothetical protein
LDRERAAVYAQISAGHFGFGFLRHRHSFVIRDSDFVIVTSHSSKTTMPLDCDDEQEREHEF